MTQGVIWKLLLEFSIPMAIGLLFQQLYNTVDTIIVGRFVGKEALAAVGSTNSIINMLVGFCAGLSLGASVTISQCYGAHDEEKLSDAVQTTMVVTFLLCVLVSALGILLVPPLLNLMNSPPDVFPRSKEYLTIYFSGISGLLIYNMGSAILRAVGDSRRPLYFLCVSALLNVVFDLLFVIRFGLGIAGVAYATILAQGISAVFVLISLTREHAAYRIQWRRLRIKGEMLHRIFSIGMPSAIQQAITAFSNVFVQSYINAFGSACMAGWSSYNKLDAFILVPVQSIAMASTTFVGQNFGANQLYRAKRGVTSALVMSLTVSALCSLVLILFRRTLLTLFTSDAQVLDFGERFIKIISPFYLLICFNQIFAGALRGVGKARTPMLIMLFSFVVFRQLYLFGTRFVAEPFIPVTLAYPFGWLLCSVLMSICYRRSILAKAQPAPVAET